jgi:hypothetical protein
MTLKQKVRDAMRKHGPTEVTDNLYTAGDIRDGKMAVVAITLPEGPTDRPGPATDRSGPSHEETMNVYGYCRLSNEDQTLDVQEAALRAAYPGIIILSEKVSGAQPRGPHQARCSRSSAKATRSWSPSSTA